MERSIGELGDGAGFTVDARVGGLLQRHGFDAEAFRALRARLLRGEAGPEANRVSGQLEPPAAGDVVELPALGTPERARLEALGLEAIGGGQVGAVVLAGGMATRFGGVVKAEVEALDGASFLELKVRDARAVARRAGGRVPVLAMTSFATDEAVREAAARLTTEEAPVRCFGQSISLRLTEDGEPFRDGAGEPSPYAPGHGDLTSALRSSGELRRFRDAGGRLLFMSNVDNLGATLDPAVLGAHLDAGTDLTCEVVDKLPGDRGGAPAIVDGKRQIVEAFRFPPTFDQDAIAVFNTNTFVFDAAAIDRDFELTWFAVRKTVDGRPAVQFERLVGELTRALPCRFLRVERDGPDGRFQPAKDPAELERRRPRIRELLEARGVI